MLALACVTSVYMCGNKGVEFLNDDTEIAVQGTKCNAYPFNSVVTIEGQIACSYFQVSSIAFWLTANSTVKI